MGLPALTVLLDDGSGTFPFDISAYVLAADGFDLSRGRDDWIGATTAGQLTVTLNNSDGRFTPGSTILGSPSPIKVDQRIRVVETVGAGGAGSGFGTGGFGTGGFGGGTGGTVFTRFTGYVKSWPVSWPATVASFAEVVVTATDAQARAERRTLRSMLEEEVLGGSPTAYYTLSEAEGATAAGDASTNQAASLAVAGSGAAPSFGTGIGPGTDGLTAVQLSGGQYLQGPTLSLPTAFSIGVWFSATTVTNPTFGMPIMAAGGLGMSILGSGAFVAGGPSVTDGKTHFAVRTYDGTTVRDYLDGNLVYTALGSLLSPPYSLALYVGGAPDTTITYTGTLSHAAVWPTKLTGSTVAALYAAGTGSTEAGTSRLIRLAGYAGVPVGTLDLSLTTVAAQTLTGSSAQDAIQQVADAEFGITYIDGTGALTFHNRNKVVAKTAPDLTLTSQWITPDVNPVLDDQQIINYLEVASQGTGATAVVANAASQTAHGRYSDSKTYLVRTDNEAIDRGNWIVSRFAEATPRYGTLTINLYGMTTTQQAQVLAALDMDCWLRVTSMASQNPGGTVADVVVQGWRETVTSDMWTITCNVVSHSLYAGVFTLDTSVLDGTDVLYV